MLPRNLIYLSLSFFLILSTGCGSADRVQGLEIKGSVTLEGEPLPSGAITLIPEGPGTSVGTTITDGTYLIDSSGGALAGEYRVEIDSSQSTGKKIKSSVGETLEEEFKNIIPEKYNRKSILKVIITQDGDHVHDFELASKP
ncbi:peptidase associated/transthyretin-like domain-containing protein [Gimesia fumaroli]|uniref:Carboxypeptidase regulatory-like domain-containing protein n=1 Tax=Gimesia fumaroli TaxID=2527976 RepID=A0A518IGL3_9PLAN|nr:carboxypeptidase regulatory-like domain-containing protein [Gimesia fumaroli]QDV52231.1 hypothetical protein Enr17x_42910 [Gimesia fumaroli]